LSFSSNTNHGSKISKGVRGTIIPKANADTIVPNTSTDRIDLAELIALLVQLADESGDILRDVQARPDKGVTDKGGEYAVTGEYVADSQTAADREVEEYCLAALIGTFPTLCYVAEESVCGIPVGEDGMCASEEGLMVEPVKRDPLSGARAAEVMAAAWPAELREVEAKRVIVYIDPLDGTGEFVAGNLLPVTNLFGVAVDGVPVAGVINQPWAPSGSRTVWGGPGAGVFGSDFPEGGAAAPMVGTNRVMRDTRLPGVLEALGVGEKYGQIMVSASGYNILSVLEGFTSLYVLTRKGTKKWDSCAGEALLRAVGGVTTDAVGRPYTYGAHHHHNLCGLLVSRCPDLHAEAVEVIKQQCAPWPLDVADPSIDDGTWSTNEQQ